MAFNFSTESTLVQVKQDLDNIVTGVDSLVTGVNIAEVGGTAIDVGNGPVTDGSIRIVQANDQQYQDFASQPVQIKKNYPLSIHNDTYFTTTVAAPNQYQCLYPPAGQQFYNAGTQTFNPLTFIPTANVTAQVISSLPLADGLGLRGTLLYYSSGPDPVVQSILIQISTLGYVGANPGTTVPNFFRAIAWLPQQFPVGFQANQGNITIVDDATGTLTYPGNVPISTNNWYSSLVYLPPITVSDFDGTNVFGNWILDYSSYHIDNPAGNDTRVAVWTKVPTVNTFWRQLIRFQSGAAASGSFGTIPLFNIHIQSVVGTGTDLMWTASKEVGGASIFFASAFGCHVE